MVGQIEAFPVTVENLQLQRASMGGGMVTGAIQNISATEGQTATVEVTFYDAAGAVMGVEQAMVQIPATDAQAAFRVEVDTEQYVGGYSYEITL